MNLKAMMIMKIIKKEKALWLNENGRKNTAVLKEILSSSLLEAAATTQNTLHQRSEGLPTVTCRLLPMMNMITTKEMPLTEILWR